MVLFHVLGITDCSIINCYILAFEFDEEDEDDQPQLQEQLRRMDLKDGGVFNRSAKLDGKSNTFPKPDQSLIDRIIFLESKLATAQRSFEEYRNLVRKTFLGDVAGLEYVKYVLDN
jgi:hypothetical protein